MLLCPASFGLDGLNSGSQAYAVSTYPPGLLLSSFLTQEGHSVAQAVLE